MLPGVEGGGAYRGRRTSRAKRDVSLARALSKLGYCSRAEAVKLIEKGAVAVNHRGVNNPSHRCSMTEDEIMVNGKRILQEELVYIAMNKPVGIVTSRSDERGRRTVYDLLGDAGKWVFPVGRLDKDTSGLLFLTNDHEFGERLTSPEHRIPKTYLVALDKLLKEEDKKRLERGLSAGIESFRPANVNVRSRHAGGAGTIPSSSVSERIELTIVEGKNRQVRRMFQFLGYNVQALERLQVGSFHLGTLKSGEWRRLTPREARSVPLVSPRPTRVPERTGLRAGRS